MPQRSLDDRSRDAECHRPPGKGRARERGVDLDTVLGMQGCEPLLGRLHRRLQIARHRLAKKPVERPIAADQRARSIDDSYRPLVRNVLLTKEPAEPFRTKGHDNDIACRSVLNNRDAEANQGIIGCRSTKQIRYLSLLSGSGGPYQLRLVERRQWRTKWSLGIEDLMACVIGQDEAGAVLVGDCLTLAVERGYIAVCQLWRSG